MPVKELTQLKITDLWQKYNGFGDFWEAEEEAIKDLSGELNPYMNLHRSLDTTKLIYFLTSIFFLFYDIEFTLHNLLREN